MTRRSDLDPLLLAWFEDGPSAMPDRVVDVVADRIGLQRQRRRWRLLRRPNMHAYLKVAAGVAAIILAVAGWQLLPGVGGSGSSTPSPTVLPTTTLGPTAAADVSIPDMTDGAKPAGRYRSYAPTTAGPTVSVVYDIPDGWSGIAGDWLTADVGTLAPNGVGIAFLGPGGLFSDPCHWDKNGAGTWPQPPDVSVGPTVADLASALQEQTAYAASAPTAVTIGGSDGVRMQLRLPATPDPATCDAVTGTTSGAYFVFGASNAAGVDLFSQGPANIWDLWILDVDGARVVVVVTHYAGTAQAVQDAAGAIVESILFNR